MNKQVYSNAYNMFLNHLLIGEKTVKSVSKQIKNLPNTETSKAIKKAGRQAINKYEFYAK